MCYVTFPTAATLHKLAYFDTCMQLVQNPLNDQAQLLLDSDAARYLCEPC